MSWITTIPYEKADQNLKRIYDSVNGPNNRIDNVLTIHSQRPHTLTGHMTLYKSVLHNSNNTLPKWYLESVGVYVSFLNNCSYCVDHHFAGLKRLLNDDLQAEQFWQALHSDKLNTFFDKKFFEGAVYAEKLTRKADAILETDIQNLVTCGFSEGEILEINQVTAYFNYANRTVLGLGVTTAGDVLGLSPNNNEDPNNWKHQ